MFFELPEGFISEVKEIMAGLIGDFFPILALFLGIVIGLWLLSALIGMFRRH